jgi:hypothetical protein
MSTTSLATQQPPSFDVPGVGSFDRLGFAEYLHGELADETEKMRRAWFRTSQLLDPIDRFHLYRDLGFGSFKDYVTEHVKRKIQSVRNDLNLLRAVESAGLAPESISDVPRPKVEELVKVARTNPGAEALALFIEQAKTARTWKESQEFQGAVSQILREKGVESEDFLRVKVTSSQKALFKDIIEEVKEVIEAALKRPVAEAEVLERVFVHFYRDVFQAGLLEVRGE